MTFDKVGSGQRTNVWVGLTVLGLFLLGMGCAEPSKSAGPGGGSADAPDEPIPDDPPVDDDPHDSSDPVDTGEPTDTGPTLPPGCDGVPGSELAYDACGVCGGDTEDCHVPWRLGHVSAAESVRTTDTVTDCDGDEAWVYEYTCLEGADRTSWVPCNRDTHTGVCPVQGDTVVWGRDLPTSTDPIDEVAACQAIFGTAASPRVSRM